MHSLLSTCDDDEMRERKKLQVLNEEARNGERSEGK